MENNFRTSFFSSFVLDQMCFYPLKPKRVTKKYVYRLYKIDCAKTRDGKNKGTNKSALSNVIKSFILVWFKSGSYVGKCDIWKLISDYVISPAAIFFHQQFYVYNSEM